MIRGIGVDLVEIHRVKKIFQLYPDRFIKRLLNVQELTEFNKSNKSRYHYLAGRFAAKEAALKALGTGLSKDFNFQDVWILNQEKTGKPLLNISDKVIRITGNIKTWVSISHTDKVAIAMVILETGNDNYE
jgi:holo-[acyl-carrier protein] synthase